MKTSKKILIGFMVMSIASFLLTPKGFAQEISLYSADDIIVETIPEIPGPNEQVSLRLKSYSFNLNNYFIAWYENGKQKSADYGNRDFNFVTGGPGMVTTVTAVIEVGDQIFRKELRFSPSQVDLLWEATDSYAPPFYKGKALPLQQSALRITAIPETLLLAPSDAPKLIYYWDRNYQRDISKSGFGRQSYSITGDPLVPVEKITVMVNDRRENSFATSTIVIPTDAYQPKILFYEINKMGRLMTNRALNTNSLVKGDTIKLSFHPLYMSSILPNFTDLFVNWNINGQEEPPQDFNHQNELHISTGGQSGDVPISVSLEGINKLLQSHTESFNLTFANQE